MNLELLTFVSLFFRSTLSCNYIDEYVNGYGYPSGSCHSLDYLPQSYSYTCTTTSSYIKSTYSTAGCSGTPTIETGTSTSFDCTGYDAQNQLNNNCDVVEYENWLYSKNCSADIYVERKSHVINQCLSTGSGHSRIIKCDDSTITFTYYDNSKCEGDGMSSHPYGESYRITKCGNKILDYCNAAIITPTNPSSTSTVSCNYIDEYKNGYGYPSDSCFSLDYLPQSYSYSCHSTSSYIKSTYSTAGCSGTPTIDSGTSTSFNCAGYNAQNQSNNNCDVVEYENWLYSKTCSSDIYVERKSYVINQCLATGNSAGGQIITCDDSTVTFTHYDNSKCEGNGTSSHPYGESYRITKCGNKILDYCNGDVIATTKAITTTTNNTGDCMIDCADPCGMNRCNAYPNAVCDFTVDCDEGCIPFYKMDGNIVNCDDTTNSTDNTTTSDPIYFIKSNGHRLMFTGVEVIVIVSMFSLFVWI